jgi:HAMP domain-containing protein
MQRPFVVGLRVAPGAALVIGSLLIQMGISTRGDATTGTAYALDATSTPSPMPLGPAFGQPTATPTLVGQAGISPPAGAPQPPGANLPVGATSATSQQTSDQIAVVAQQVAQVTQDPSLPVDAKAHQITLLASQFNQLVDQWQMQSVATGTQGVPSATATPALSPALQPTPPAVTNPVPPAAVQPTPPVVTNPAAPPAASTPDQLRTQISGVAQQMAQVSQDASIPVDLKTAQLNNLASQFNQLMLQLQQHGG